MIVRNPSALTKGPSNSFKPMGGRPQGGYGTAQGIQYLPAPGSDPLQSGQDLTNSLAGFMNNQSGPNLGFSNPVANSSGGQSRPKNAQDTQTLNSLQPSVGLSANPIANSSGGQSRPKNAQPTKWKVYR